MACATIIGLSTSAQAAQVNYTSWTAVSQAIIDQLQDGKQEYESGNTAGATSDFMSAYNTVYVGANFSTVVQQTISSETFTSQQQQFQNIQNYSYTTGNNVEIDAAISVLSQDLTTTAEQLDANTELKNPSEYAKDLEKQIQEERKKLDAAKSKKEGRGSRTWTQIAEQMNEILDNAYKAYQGGHVSHGVELVNEAYYQYYEKLGFEKNVMNAISGNRVSQVEYTFKLSRQSISNKKPASEVKNYITSLKAMLLEDAKTLDGSTGNVNPVTQFVTSSFGQAFLILLREGLEAILVVAAIIAYLVKSGNKKFIRYIYLGLVAGLVGSGIIAIIFMMLFNGNGPEQEIMEGVVALIAMVMLLYTSNWMLSRSSTQAWDEYIKKETAIAVSRGSVISLALLSFLAVFREGAETVMFYQAIFSMTSGSTTGIWAGFVSASISLI
ncbi:MAG: FTR1 family protein, partial [Bifidobacteriaceae bacterium]|nr:FTR1 family protein [Bifidobacteriaceae bacterium]